MEEKNGVNLKDLNAEGFIRFSIKAKDTNENESVHKSFKEFCKLETDDNYTLGLRKLLEYYQGDFKYEALYQEIEDLRLEIAKIKEQLSAPSEPEKEKDTGAF